MIKKRRVMFIITCLFFAQMLHVCSEVVSLTVGVGAALGFFIGDFAGIYSYAKCKCK
jgi:hypothetical protein